MACFLDEGGRYLGRDGLFNHKILVSCNKLQVTLMSWMAGNIQKYRNQR